MDELDPAILNEFLVEAGELLDALDAALLSLERNGADADALATALRSLHTLKGNAGFFGLSAIVELAHAAESSLIPARDQNAAVGMDAIDALFEAGEALRRDLERVRAGVPIGPGDESLRHRLDASSERHAPDVPAQDQSAQRAAIRALAIQDLRASLGKVESVVSDAMRAGAGSDIDKRDVHSIIEGMLRTSRFFDLEPLERCLRRAHDLAGSTGDVDDRFHSEFAAALRPVLVQAKNELDQIENGPTNSTAIEPGAAPSPHDVKPESTRPSRERRSIRVDVERLESLLDLVGELVLRKNAVARLVQSAGPLDAAPNNVREIVHRFAEDLDRLTADLQHATMRVRMQPLRVLFARFPRLIRDLARETGKDVELVIDGAETEVDRAVIEGLAEVMAHLLRNSLDHGIETPDERERAGKPRAGVLRVSAGAAGDYATIRIADDGRGVDQARLLERAIELGVIAPQAAATMSDAEALQLILTPGFSTASRISNLSGRGVGMDAVRRAVERLGGSIQLESTPGAGTAVTLRVPLSISILEALTVTVGAEEYAIPLAAIVETRRLRPDWPIEEFPVHSLRDLFHTPGQDHGPDPFAVIVEQHGRRVALAVTELRGRTDIVTKSLSRSWLGSAPFSAATIDPDGRVVLVLDVARTLERASALASLGAACAEEES